MVLMHIILSLQKIIPMYIQHLLTMTTMGNLFTNGMKYAAGTITERQERIKKYEVFFRPSYKFFLQCFF